MKYDMIIRKRYSSRRSESLRIVKKLATVKVADTKTKTTNRA